MGELSSTPLAPEQADAFRDLHARLLCICNSYDLRDDTLLFERALDALAQLMTAPLTAWVPTHRHLQRGSVYRLVGSALLQTEEPIGDGAFLALYQDAQGAFWVRPAEEFKDGRFEPLTVEADRG